MTDLEKIIDEEYSQALSELQARTEMFDEEYENLRSNWIMRKIELGIISLLP
jgi:hypothetical protein